MKVARVLLSCLGAAAILAVALTATAMAGQATPAKAAVKPHVQTIALTIAEANGIDRISRSSENFAIAAGVPVRVTVTNQTRRFHTLTVPGLHLSLLIGPARGRTPETTTFTFTTHRTGTFAWYCAFCAGGAHGQPHMMGGTIYVIVDPSVFS